MAHCVLQYMYFNWQCNYFSTHWVCVCVCAIEVIKCVRCCCDIQIGVTMDEDVSVNSGSCVSTNEVISLLIMLISIIIYLLNIQKM